MSRLTCAELLRTMYVAAVGFLVIKGHLCHTHSLKHTHSGGLMAIKGIAAQQGIISTLSEQN